MAGMHSLRMERVAFSLVARKLATKELLCGATNALAEEARVNATRAMMLAADTFMIV